MQRQESEETISASEVSDDGYDCQLDDKPPSVMKEKQSMRETRSQAAEKRSAEPAPGPVLRSLRPQRGSRGKTAEVGSIRTTSQGSSDTLEKLAGSPDLSVIEPVDNPFSDDVRIDVVDDLGEDEDRSEHGRIDSENLESQKQQQNTELNLPVVSVVSSSIPIVSTSSTGVGKNHQLVRK